jgi:putative inorganic carbon (HCO3(-)) transporter
VFSIAVAQVLLALAAVLVIATRRWRMPPVWIPLLAYLGWTILAKAAAEDLLMWNPQIRKFYVFLVLPVVYSAVRNANWARRTLLLIAGAGVISSLVSFVQFARRWAEARTLAQPFYDYYTPRRTTGFMSHWMTFSGEMLVVAAILGAFVLFAAASRRERWLAAGGLVITTVAVILNQTRSIWLAAAGAAVYLVAAWRPRWLLALPVIAAGIFIASPQPIQQRAISIVTPHGTTDSNEHRYVTWRTGIEMVRRNPWLGVGPHRVDPLFQQYVPMSIPRPMPVGWYGHLHNVYLQTAAERGIPALVFLLWLLGRFGWDWRRGLSQASADSRFVLHAAIATLIGTLISGFFEHNLGNSEILHLLLAVAACAYAAIPTRRPESLREASPR